MVGSSWSGAGFAPALAQAGIAVPDDVAVTGFDDIGFAEISRPSLTTVRQPVADIAAESAGLLHDRLAGEHGTAQHRGLQPTVLVRESARR
jgi:LacI family transcriptional regulator